MRRELGELRRSWRASHLLVLIPLGFIALISVIDILSGPSVHLGPLLVVAPAITASFAGARLAALIGALAVAAQVLVGVFHGGLTTTNHEAQIAALIVVSAVIVVYCRLRESHGRQLSQVRSVSDAVQQALLRPIPHSLGPLHVAVMYLAAEDEARVGGDLYAATRTAHTSRLIIGDVRGKGLDAVGDSAAVLGAFRELAHQHTTLPDLASAMDASFCRQIRELAEADTDARERFVTALLIDIPDTEPRIRITNCGHPPPLLLRGHQIHTLHTAEPAPPLGLCELRHVSYRADTHDFLPGDILLLYTDGVTEARDANRAFYPLTDKVAAWTGTDPDELVRHLRHDLLAHGGGQLGDDAVLIAIERTTA